MEESERVLNVFSKEDVYDGYVVMVSCGALITLLGLVIESEATLIVGAAIIGLIVIILLVCWLYILITLILGK